MQITRTSQEFLSIYDRLRATRETLDQSELDSKQRVLTQLDTLSPPDLVGSDKALRVQLRL